MAKCPSCDNSFSSMTGEAMLLNIGASSYKAVAFTCPSCRAALGASLDPLALKTDTVNEVIERVGKLLRR